MGKQVAAQFARERKRLTAILRAAATAGASPQHAITQALADLRSEVSLAQWEHLFTAALTTVGQESGARLISQWQDDGLLPATMTYDALRQGSAIADALARGVTRQQAQATVKTTADRLASAWDKQIATGIDASAIDDLISTLTDAYDGWQAGRIPSIASLQVVGGWELGQLDAAFSAANVTGAQAVRTWVTVGDAKVRPEHAAADGQQVGIGENFSVGGEDLMYPCDPSGSAAQIMGCRCTAEYDLQLQTGGGDSSSDDFSGDE